MGLAQTQPPTRTNDFQGGAAAVGPFVNQEFDRIYGVLNGSLSDQNLASNAGISGSKIATSSIPSSALADPTLSLGTAFVPIGGVIDFWSDNTTPNGWQVCDGSFITDVASPLNGKNTPNLINTFIRGVTNQNLRLTPILGGEDTHVLTSGELASHGHGVSDPGHGHGVNDPGHAHSFTRQMQVMPNQNFSGSGFNPITNDGNAISTNASNTGVSIRNSGANISIQNSGSSTAHNNIPGYTGMVKIMRIK